MHGGCACGKGVMMPSDNLQAQLDGERELVEAYQRAAQAHGCACVRCGETGRADLIPTAAGFACEPCIWANLGLRLVLKRGGQDET